MHPMRKKLHWKIVVAATLALSCLHALGWGSGSRQALASQGPRDFCEITDADELLNRAGKQTPANTIKLVVSRERVEPGMLIQARLVNTTQLVARYGAEFRIQRYGRRRWTTDSSSPDGPWPRRVGKLSPNQAAGCYRFPVPAEQGPGRYRFLTSVDVGSAKKGRVAEFRVQVTK